MKKRILVIDDEHLMLYGLKKALSQEQVEVDTAGSAGEAKLALSSCRYDLCLIDIRLPDENGFKLMEVVRDLCPDIKIILMTAGDITLDDELNENIQKAKANGVCHFLCKPFDLDELKGLATQIKLAVELPGLSSDRSTAAFHKLSIPVVKATSIKDAKRDHCTQVSAW